MQLVIGSFALFSVAAVVYLYSASLDTTRASPQGCRMSYMYESYVPQSDLDVARTWLATRYSLWLYREVDEHGIRWEHQHVAKGVPVLFIPGSGGSKRQVRSIASSAVMQYWDAPSSVSPEFRLRSNLKPLDFFTMDFNEDLSGFHGPTLEAQTAYASRAIEYILSLYPRGTSIIVMGHSMGGIVATSLLPSPNISAVITMSTPHTLPPARFDARIDALYERNQLVLARDPTPILSLCGGATDMMIPSESCILPLPLGLRGRGSPYRRTIFTSGLEGAWTGVGHQVMVWCHQVRWRIARAALEFTSATSAAERATILDRWLRDGHILPHPLVLPEADAEPTGSRATLALGVDLILTKPHGAHTYILPIPTTKAKFVLLLSRGSIGPVGPQKASSLKVKVFESGGVGADGVRSALKPNILKPIPSPIPGAPFPIPTEGSDESEGIVLFEADVTLGESSNWIGVRVEGGEGAGWVTGGFVVDESFTNGVTTIQLLLGKVSVSMPSLGTRRASFEFPHLLSNALIVYRIIPHHRKLENSCAEPLLAPLLVHTPHPSQTHYFPLTHRVLLHTHAAGPHVRVEPTVPPGLRFTVYSSSGSVGCKSDLIGFDLGLDWHATLGRWASRYFAVLPSWAIGVVAVILFQVWGIGDNNVHVPTLEQSLVIFMGRPLRRLLLCSVLLSVVPLPEMFYLGNRGEPLFFAIAPLLLLISTGLVCVSVWGLQAGLCALGKLCRLSSRRRRTQSGVPRRTIISMCLIFLLVFSLVPWQVAFLGCWLKYLYNCASSKAHIIHVASIPNTMAGPLLRHEGDATEEEPPRLVRPPSYIANNHNHSMHLLLLTTWLLPLAAPVLIVWMRTLVVAGPTTPFEGDRSFLGVMPFLILVDFVPWTNGPLYEHTLSVRWCFACLAAASFLVGSRKVYFVFDVAKVAIGLAVLLRIGPRAKQGHPRDLVILSITVSSAVCITYQMAENIIGGGGDFDDSFNFGATDEPIHGRELSRPGPPRAYSRIRLNRSFSVYHRYRIP
ncbi:GPI inositol-deacylase [Mycena venus]|uniref:GPI inositol-deacylase n=1 Tax=Mycena venus TaxID=2733690 RepID=A0A8H7CH74_9AGAR|nr:GPI inositol-deacylase [Mycena venus]